MPDKMKNTILTIRRQVDITNAIAASLGKPVPNIEPLFIPVHAANPQRMLITADIEGVQHSVAAALCRDISIDCASLAGVRYGLQLSEGLKIVDDHTTFDDPRPRLSESDDLEEVKDSIFAVMEEELVKTHLRLCEVLASYSIHVLQHETEIDPVLQALSVKASTERPVEQLNSIMSNMKVRKAIKGSATIRVSTAGTPPVREFYYQDECLVGSKPDMWDKGMNYNAGDFVNMPGTSGGMYRYARKLVPQNYRAMGTLDKFWKEYNVIGTQAGRMRGGRMRAERPPA